MTEPEDAAQTRLPQRLKAWGQRTIERAQALAEKAQQWKPVRVFKHFGEQRGALLANGLSFQAIFSVFAAVWVGFSIIGLVLGADAELRESLFRLIRISVPGLLDLGDGGAIDPNELLNASSLGWTGALALAGALFTAVAWLGAARGAVREIAQLPLPQTNFVLLKLRDLGLAIAFGAAVLLSAVLLFASTQALQWVFPAIGIDTDSQVAAIAARIIALTLMFALDAAILATLYRILAGVKIPPRPLVQAALLGAAGLAALKILGTALLGGASSNPLLASFAVIIGLLIWFNLICQVILIAAAWLVVTATDDGVPLDPVGERERRELEARLRLEIEEEVRAELEAALPRAVRWLARRRSRRQVSEQN